MRKDNVIVLKKPESIIVGQITEILHQEAGTLLAQALEAEIDHFISRYRDLSLKRYVYSRADGVYCPVAWMTISVFCASAGATENAAEELAALEDGFRGLS